MATRSFDDYLASRLSKQEIKEVKIDAQMEYESMLALQHDISKAVIDYMSQNDVGFNDVVQGLGKSPSQVSKIIKGEGNLTIATIAQIFAFSST
jgi:NCAIR mutase (PurE)-related protein